MPAFVDTEGAVVVSEQTATEGGKHADDVPAIDAPSEGPSRVVDPPYTVATLPGSGSSPRVDLKPEPEEMTEIEVPSVEKVEGSETPKIVTPQDEEPVEPAAIAENPSWTRSYSVTSQPGSPRISPKAELKELESEPQPVESVQEPPVATPIADVPETVVTPAAEAEDPAEPVSEEDPKPAWTHSYSVTSQPGSPRVSPKQVHEEIPQVEEIKPSWTQSYSVISQPGSPRIPPKEDLQEPIVELAAVAGDPTTVVTPLVQDATTVPPEAEAVEEPKSVWTPSYSVTTLDGQTEQTPLEGAEPEPEVVSVPKTLADEAPEPKPEVDVQVTDAPSSESLTAKDENPERPKSPWTPSYSVTTLPGSSSTEQPNPDLVTEEPSAEAEPPTPEPAKTAEMVEYPPKENGTTSDVFGVHEAVSQLAVRDEPQVNVEIPEPDRHGLDLVSLARFRQIARSIE